MDKIICHIDVNSAFLSWTAAHRIHVLGEKLDLRTIPSAICGDKESRHSIILAKSGPAKAFGIKTGEPLFQAKLKCPHLFLAPPDYGLYVECSRAFIDLLREVAPVVEQYSIDEAWIDLSGTQKLYGPPVLVAEKLKNRIREELGFTANIGISSNKLLAKMAGDFEKPDRVHTLFPEEIEKKLWPLPVGELFCVGHASVAKLRRMGIFSIGDLAKCDPARLKSTFHKFGEVIWSFANGICKDEVTEDVVLNKGYGNSTTTPKDVSDTVTAHKVLLSLSETVGMRMRKDRQVARCVTVHLRTNQFYSFSHQAQLPQPTDITSEIYTAACHIFDEMWDQQTPLRQLGVYVSKVSRELCRQYTLFDKKNYDKLSQLDRTVDDLRERFGEDAVKRACFIEEDLIEHMTGGLTKDRRTGVTKPV